MPDHMRPLPFADLVRWALEEWAHRGAIYGVPGTLFYTPSAEDRCGIPDLYGQYLATPIGPAAGPHTQLAQNIVCAWLVGGRFIELKTVQIADELEIPRPCIDMADEGYNVEWSQELKLDASAREYVKAWALIHVLRRVMGLEERVPFGTVFNMSVGYDLAGVQSAEMTRFMDCLADASEPLAEIREVLAVRYPHLADVAIPAQITNNVTLSTMHGCPPDEIEQIARYLLGVRRLHTTVKLNPTLLGKHDVRRILHDELGYDEIRIPDAVFDHDLQYDRAVALIAALRRVADAEGLTFGVKLSNTLAMANHRGVLPGDEMYMSGRALYPITLQLFDKLQRTFDGALRVSYSAGVDALNVVEVLACGARPVTVASDLLKPGGYGRMRQYLDQLDRAMREVDVQDLDALAGDAVARRAAAAARARRAGRYKKGYRRYGAPKVDSGLGLYDCIVAPCVAQCAVCQDVPDYAWWIAQGADDRALAAILARNPLPGVTGHVCPQLCQTRCTRSDYEQPVEIRALKRFAAARGRFDPRVWQAPPTGRKAAVVGSGPSGLAAAWYLALAGVDVTVYDSRDMPGGMLSIAPPFRLPRQVVQQDIDRITHLGVHLALSHPIAEPPERLLDAGYDSVYLAHGYPHDARLSIDGIEGEGVFSALEVLERAARGRDVALGQRVVVIGGGNTAMDAACTAQRMVGRPATVVYRRTRAEMPADEEEVAGLLAEGNTLIELASPVRVVRENGRVVGLACTRNRLGAPGPDGRPRPEPVPDSAFRIEADAIVVAIGQAPGNAFLEGSSVRTHADGRVIVDAGSGRAAERRIYAGGDAVRGPATIVEACADGRRAAEAMCREMGIPFNAPAPDPPEQDDRALTTITQARARRETRARPETLPVAQRGMSKVVELTLGEEAARREASRCLQCASVCDKCIEVCPNRANQGYAVAPVHWQIPVLSCAQRALGIAGYEAFEIRQSRQIVHIGDLCNECGNCATFCVHQGRPHADKPRLYLTWDGFEAQEDDAFYLDGARIWRKQGRQASELAATSSGLVYEDAYLRVRLSRDMQPSEMVLKQPFDGTRSLRGAGEMAVLLRWVPASLPWLFEGGGDGSLESGAERGGAPPARRVNT
ncbi:MAG: putative selenate reductase subunit YgfK [Anaerolineae bacterium]|nr:putative selenate reductase subunit YgfK [Anaerolineae bacterium]